MGFQTLQFSGGMNDWLSPSLLPNTTAQLILNADVSNGKICPIRKPKMISETSMTSFNHYGTDLRSAVKWYGRHYWSNNTASSSPYYGGSPENFIGMPYPAYSGTGSNVSITKSSGTHTGTYHYCVTFVSANGWEGAPGSLNEYEVEQILSNEDCTIAVSWTDSRISYAKIYRTISNGADFFNIGEVTASGSTFTDNIDDSTAQLMNPLTSQYNYPPPDGGKYLCEYGGVFFLAVGDLLYFSETGNPHAWNPTHFISMDNAITGICREFQGVLVFTTNNVYRIIGADNEATVTKTLIPGNQGCRTWKSIATLNNAPIWLSNDGLCVWDGESVSVVNYGKIRTDGINVRFACACRDKYYLFHSDGCIVFDRRNGDIFVKTEIVVNYAFYDSDTDKLILKIGSNLFEYGKGDYLKWKYVSPYIGADNAGNKVFRELRYVCNTESTASVSTDGESNFSVSKRAGNVLLKLPFDCMGIDLAVIIESKGELREVLVSYDK